MGNSKKNSGSAGQHVPFFSVATSCPGCVGSRDDDFCGNGSVKGRVKALLAEQKEKLESLAERLAEKETLGVDDVDVRLDVRLDVPNFQVKSEGFRKKKNHRCPKFPLIGG